MQTGEPKEAKGQGVDDGSLRSFVNARLEALGKTLEGLADFVGFDPSKVDELYTKTGTVPEVRKKVAEFLGTVPRTLKDLTQKAGDVLDDDHEDISNIIYWVGKCYDTRPRDIGTVSSDDLKWLASQIDNLGPEGVLNEDLIIGLLRRRRGL